MSIFKKYRALGKETFSAPVTSKMAAIPMESGLIAVALIIRSRDGPRFVYHYPPRPSTKATDRDVLWGTDLHNGNLTNASLPNHDSDDSDLEERQNLALKTRLSNLDLKGTADKYDKGKKKSHHVDIEELEGDDHFEASSGEHVVPWEHLFEFHTNDLESILTPSRAYHKKKFDLSLDPLHFVSYPMHIREDGLWKKKKIKKSKKPSRSTDSLEKTSVDSSSKTEVAKHIIDNESEDGDDHGGMTMFNVVFIMDIGKEGADTRVNEMYDHIVKKFNKALKHAQASSDYVWKESEMILSMKEKAREESKYFVVNIDHRTQANATLGRPMSWLWNEISIKSTLACAIRDIYKAASSNKIATIHFAATPPLDLSLQIPFPTFLTRLPSPTEKALPGMLVTSANPMINDEGEEDPSHLNKHFALLLLDDEAKIIAEIQADNTELSAPLIECIRLCKPTLSFYQVAQTNSIDCSSLLILAQHLIYYRRAIAFPPLHAREVYIVSPNCDSRKLPLACVTWKKAFPLAPSLPSFLAALSAAPRPYKTFAPSKDHRPTYIDMLAWLIRGGWVTQLRTFAWILIWPELVYEVDYQLKGEALEKAKKASKSNSGSSESNESTDESSSDMKFDSSDSHIPMTTAQAAENARLERLAQKLAREAAEDAAAFAKMPKPVATDHPSCNNAEHLQTIAPYIIKDPHKVSHEESLYIKALGDRFKDVKAKEYWPRFTKYFNGIEAMEMIALRENMKRKETMTIITHYQEHLLVCKHW
jgi:hypothetical protein